MIKQHKDILATVIRDLRHDLLGYTAKDGTLVRGDLDRELERLGVLPDGRVQPIDALPNATAPERQAHYAAEQFIDAARRQGKTVSEARKQFVEEASYSWINRLVALRALEARKLINGTLRPNEDYGGVSEALYLLAQTDPARVAAPDGGWYAVLEIACAAQAAALPGLFGAGDPVLTLRPSITALRRCVDRIGKGPVSATAEATDAAFADPDAIGWAYQFYQEEAKAVAFASFKAGKKADSRATIAAATQLFTEPYMVKWLLQNSLGRSYHEIHPQSALPTDWEYYIHPTQDRPLNAPAPTAATLEMLTVLDPCVGSGHFLREAFDLLAAMYREQHPDWAAQRVVETILRQHLHGIDIDPRAVQLAALTLYMRALDLLRDEARARRQPMPSWTPPQINLATTPSGLDGTALERHLARHPEDRPLRPVLERIFETLSQAEILGSLLRPGAEIDAAIAKVQAPRTRDMFTANDGADSIAQHDPAELKRLVLDRIAIAFRTEASSADPADALFGREAERGVRLLQLLNRKYAVVVTNPPYMGSSNMNAPLKSYVERNYKPGRADLYAAFILRCLDLSSASGRVAMVTQQSWMFLRSFVNLRAVPEEQLAETRIKREFAGLLRETRVEALAHLGRYAFSEIGNAFVAPLLFTIKAQKSAANHYFWAIRLVTPRPSEEQAALLRAAVHSGIADDKKLLGISPLKRRQDIFAELVNGTMAYWLSEKALRYLSTSYPKIGIDNPKVLDCRTGWQTNDNTRYWRYQWEIPSLNSHRWLISEQAVSYSRWSANIDGYVENEYKGVRIRSMYKIGIADKSTLCAPTITWSMAANGSLGVRVKPSGANYNKKICALLFSDQRFNYDYISFLNSRIASYLIRTISQTIDMSAGYVALLPRVELPYGELAVRLKRASINHVAVLRLLTLESYLDTLAFDKLDFDVSETQSALADTGTPAGFHPLLAGYDALPELPAEIELPELPHEVVEYLEQHERINPSPTELARIKVRLRGLYEAGYGAKDEGADDAGDAEGGEGDEGEAAVAGAHIPIPTETFLEELSVRMELHPISIYWLLEELRAEGVRCTPEERRLLEDRLSVLALRLLGHRWPKQIAAGEPLPAWADTDGIIPLVNLGTGEATLAERLRERLREEDDTVGAQRIEALLSELTGATSLEDWLARIFWPRHVRQFKSRPIAWHLLSRPVGVGKGRGARRAPLFECLVYYHATGGDALARLRTQYVEPLLRREESALNEALGKDNTEAAASATLRVQELRDFLARIQQVEREGFVCAELDTLLAKEPLDRWSGDGISPPAGRDDLVRQERAWRVDLNDGVRVNIAPIEQAGLLPGEVLRAADAKKAIADRARWRSDERRWVREGKLPRPGWLPESVPESPEWTRKAPERAAERAKLEERRRVASEYRG